MKKNAILSNSDTFSIKLYDSSESRDMFGEDYLEEWGCNVPTELIERYKKNETERRQIQEELDKIDKEQSKNRI